MSSKTCTHNDELLTLGAIGLLSTEDQVRLEAQVSACTPCRERWQDYQALAARMPRLLMDDIQPSRALNGQAKPEQNGKKPAHPALFTGPSADDNQPGAGDLSGSARPDTRRPERSTSNHRMARVLSGVAAAVLLVGLLGGVWLLTLSRAPKSGHRPGIAQTRTPTVITYNPCSNELAKGVQGGVPACGVVVVDFTANPATLIEVDPTTGTPLTTLKPLQIGNAFLSALSADHRTLALGLFPQDGSDATIQMAWLDSWKLAAKIQLPLTQNQNVESLAITPDGTSIYAVVVDYSTTPTQAQLWSYSYDRGTDRLAFRWKAPLPFAPGDASSPDNSSFALSADGQTAYLFSAAINPPQLAAVPLNARGIGSPQTLPLPSIASGAAPPFGDENYTYKPGDPIYSWYQPAVMFAPQQNKLYLVHAEASDPGKDVLVVIGLLGTQMTLGPDIIIQGENLALAEISGPGQGKTSQGGPVTPSALLAASQNAASLLPQRGLQPYKGKPYNGRSETGAVSSDGRWIYLSGTTSTPEITQGTWNGEQQTYLGLLKIDTQTGRVVGSWYKGEYYTSLTFGPDGTSLYLFGPPPGTDLSTSYPSFELQVFDTQQGKLAHDFSAIESGWFILPLP